MLRSRSTRGNGLPFVTLSANAARASKPSEVSTGSKPHFGSRLARSSRLTWLSSTTSTDFPARSVWNALLDWIWSAGAAANCAVKENSLPFPSLLFKLILPPISLTKRAEMERPRPVPPNSRVVEVSACEKASKIFLCLSGAMPIPVSRTAKRMANNESSEGRRSALMLT